jgi:hypothetical protein
VTRALADLALGMRLSVAGGRSGWARLAMITAGIGLGVAMLLVTATVPVLFGARDARIAARADTISYPEPPRGDDSLLLAVADTEFRGETIHGRVVQAEGDRAPVPPGLTRLPAAGELMVSPALAGLMDREPLLRERWDATPAARIGTDGLTGPAELAFYLGSDTLTEAPGAHRMTSFGRGDLESTVDPVIMLLGVVALAALLVPVAVFVATAVRFGGETRDRRLAAVRLVGADTAMTRRIAAGETLAGALLGLLAGGVLYAAALLIAAATVPRGLSFAVADARPAPLLLALVVIAVPAAAVGVTLSALRQVVVEPLGVVRSGTPRHRRLWWRLILPVAGIALLWPLRDGLRPGTEPQVLGGVCALLIGVSLLLPWLVEAVVRRLPAGGIAWDLALRRLQLDSGTAVRAVSGIAVSVAGAIALQGMLAAVQVQYAEPGSASAGPFQYSISTSDGRSPLPGAVEDRNVDVGEDDTAHVAGCPVLQQFAALPSCADGDAFRLAGSGLKPGAPVTLGGRSWTLPDGTPTVTAPSGGLDMAIDPATLLITPGALGGVEPEIRNTEFYVALDAGDPDAADRMRTAVLRADPTAAIYPVRYSTFENLLAGVRQAVLVVAVALLVLVGASMLVNVGEQLHERRRPLAVLIAFGTRRSTLTGSVLVQVALPVLSGLLLAVVTGTALAAALQKATGTPIRVDWTGIALTSGTAALVVLAATAASLPLLWRLTRPGALRSE